jgi:hypothetical protein
LKWFPLLIFITLLVLFFAFGKPLESGSTSQAQATVTTTATLWVPTSALSPTADTAMPNIFYNLNMSIEDMERLTKFNELEHINGASYQIVHVEFRPENGVPSIFQVDVRCECARNDQCCSSTQTFVVTMAAMDAVNYEQLLLNDVPASVRDLEVWCYDHASLDEVLSVPWVDVVSFLQDNLEGFKLWSKVTHVPGP